MLKHILLIALALAQVNSQETCPSIASFQGLNPQSVSTKDLKIFF